MIRPFGGAFDEVRYSDLGTVSALSRAADLAELALAGFGESGEQASAGVRDAVLALAAILAGHSNGADLPDPDGGLTIWTGTRANAAAGGSKPYRLRLMTTIDMFPYVLAVTEGRDFTARALLDDGSLPAPGEFLDAFRYRAAVEGLLWRLEDWAQWLVDTEDYNHGGGIDDDYPPPEATLERVREIRSLAADLAVATEVMAS